jgi:hypothetical protein
MSTAMAELKSFKNGASQGSIGYNSEKTVIVLLNCKAWLHSQAFNMGNVSLRKI